MIRPKAIRTAESLPAPHSRTYPKAGHAPYAECPNRISVLRNNGGRKNQTA